MNDIQNLIDRELGICSRFNYDNVLKRLVVHRDESFYGLQSPAFAGNFDQDPPIFACRFAEASGYEHILALANEDGRVAIQDTRTVRTASALEGFQCHNNAVFDLAWRPHHMNFVTVSGDHTACLWDVAESAPRRLLAFSNHTRSVKTAAFGPGEPFVLATGARDGHVLVWDVRVAPQPAVVLRPDSFLASCHSGAAPKTPGSHGKRARIEGRRAVGITGLAFRDGRALFSCGECDGSIKLWDLRKNYGAHRREPLPARAIPYAGGSTRNGYTNLLVDAARLRLYASCMDGVVYRFDAGTETAAPERRYVGHESGTFYVKAGLSPDGAYLLSGSSDRRAYLWNVARSRPLLRLGGHRAEVTCAAWRPRGDAVVVTCGDDARHNVWRVGRESPEPGAEPLWVAEEPPPADDAAPAERTPSSRRRATTPGPRGVERAARRSRRRLLDLAGGDREADDAPAKRLRADEGGEPPGAVSTDRPRSAPAAGASLASPAKNCERRTREVLGPRGPRGGPPDAAPPRTPAKVRVASASSPTRGLPDFVRDGEAPHLRLMSPAKRKRDSADWLTLLVREKRGRPAGGGEGAPPPAAPPAPAPPAPRSPREGAPARRGSVSDRTPRSAAKTRTLLKYFSVRDREK